MAIRKRGAWLARRSHTKTDRANSQGGRLVGVVSGEGGLVSDVLNQLQDAVTGQLLLQRVLAQDHLGRRTHTQDERVQTYRTQVRTTSQDNESGQHSQDNVSGQPGRHNVGQYTKLFLRQPNRDNLGRPEAQNFSSGQPHTEFRTTH